MLVTVVQLAIYKSVRLVLIHWMATAMRLEETVQEEVFAITRRELVRAFLDFMAQDVNIKQPFSKALWMWSSYLLYLYVIFLMPLKLRCSY